MSCWFRHYAGMMRDDKLVRVALKSGQTIERVLWVWGAVLESASDCNDGGKFDFDVAEAAYFLRIKPAPILAILEALEAAGHIADSVVTRWKSRQFQSDSSKQRVAAHRARKRGCNVTGENDVTLHDRYGNAPDTDTDTDTEIIETNVSIAHLDAQPLRADELRPEDVVDYWNRLAARLGKPQVRALTPERRVKLRQRIAGYTLDDFREVMGNVERSPFLRGDRGWHGCNFDWVTKKTNFQKILEGNYAA